MFSLIIVSCIWNINQNLGEWILLTVYTGGQITTPSSSQCAVNYLDHGPGTTMDLSEFYQTYFDDPTVTSLSDCTQLCDEDSQCKAIKYMEEMSKVGCGIRIQTMWQRQGARLVMCIPKTVLQVIKKNTKYLEYFFYCNEHRK